MLNPREIFHTPAGNDEELSAYSPSRWNTLAAHRERARRNQRSDRNWMVYGSDISDYEKSFYRLLGDKRIAQFLDRKDAPVVVDFMAPSETLASLFYQLREDQAPLGVTVSYQDRRPNWMRERDETLNITQIKGDISESSTWKKVTEVLEGKKADLILERAVGGLECLPKHPAFYALALQRMWKMLAVAGVMLIQLPDVIEHRGIKINLKAWERLLNKSSVQARYSSAYLNEVMLISKQPESPQFIPLPLEGSL